MPRKEAYCREYNSYLFLLPCNWRLQYAYMDMIETHGGIHKVSVLSCAMFSLLVLEVSRSCRAFNGIFNFLHKVSLNGWHRKK